MARDYKNRASARKKQKQSAPIWIWLLSGYLLGAFSVGLAWLKLGTTTESKWIGSKPTVSEPAIRHDIAEEDEPEVTPPQFDFYNLLPEMEVVIPDAELNTEPLANRGKNKKPDNSRYLLQVGSFRSHKDAEKVKAKLALLGFQASIHKSQRGNQTWHRVRLGPYAKSQVIKASQKQLAQNGYDTLLVKAK